MTDPVPSKDLVSRIDDCLHCLWIDRAGEERARRLLREAMEALRAASESPVDTCREPVPCAAQLVLDRVEQAFREAGYVGDDLVEGVANLRALFDAARATQPPGDGQA